MTLRRSRPNRALPLGAMAVSRSREGGAARGGLMHCPGTASKHSVRLCDITPVLPVSSARQTDHEGHQAAELVLVGPESVKSKYSRLMLLNSRCGDVCGPSERGD